MEEKEKEPDYHNLDSPKAAHYIRTKKMELAFLEGRLDSPAPKDASPTPTTVEVIPASSPVPQSSSDTVITFSPDSIPLEFIFNVESEKKVKVKVVALQVSETDEAVTVLLDKKVEFTFPVLYPFFLGMKDGRMHKVCYAGGTCQIGPCKFISFIKVEQ